MPGYVRQVLIPEIMFEFQVVPPSMNTESMPHLLKSYGGKAPGTLDEAWTVLTLNSSVKLSSKRWKSW